MRTEESLLRMRKMDFCLKPNEYQSEKKLEKKNGIVIFIPMGKRFKYTKFRK